MESLNNVFRDIANPEATSTVISNIPEVLEKANVSARRVVELPTYLKASPVEAASNNVLPAAQQETFNIDSAMESILGEKTVGGMMTRISSLKGSLDKQKSLYEREAIRQAEAEFNIPEIQRAMNLSHQNDMRYPEYALQGDSPRTLKLRQQFMQAQSASKGQLKEKLAGNDAYRNLQIQGEALVKLADAHVSKRFQKEMQAEDLVESLGAEATATLPIILGDRGHSPLQVAAQYNSLNQKGKQAFVEATSGGITGIPAKALEGNPFAIEGAVNLEAQARGISTGEAKARVIEVLSGTVDPIKAAENWKLVKSSYPEEERKRVEKYFSPAMSDADEGTKKEAQREWARLAVKAADVRATQNMRGDVGSWSSPAQKPLFLTEMEKNPTKNGGKLSTEEVVAEISRLPVPQRKQAMQEFQAYYAGAIATNNKGVFGKVPFYDAEQLKVSLASQSYAQEIGSRIKNITGETYGAAKSVVGAATGAALFPVAPYFLKPEDRNKEGLMRWTGLDRYLGE